MNSNHLISHSKPYEILKKIAGWYHSVYYEEICVINADNIPDEGPVIFAPNHQNALMDALAIIFTTSRQPVFMARADIFKQGFIRKVLNFLKIIPVYRIRDGIESLSNNDQSFELAFQVLKNNGAVGIMPEGNHGEHRALRPLKKGIARLAIQSQELLGEKAAIKIIPVGLEFSSYRGFRSNMVVNFGKPIEVNQFLEEYRNNAAKGLQSMRARLAEDLKELMIHIEPQEHYQLIFDAKELYSYSRRHELPSFCDKFILDKKLSDRLVELARTDPDQLIQLKTMLRDLNYASIQLKIAPWVFSWKAPQTVPGWLSDIARYMIFAPVFVLAALFHAVPYMVSEFLSNRVEDKQFVSSMRFVISFALYILWYLLILLIPFSILLKLVIFMVMPLFGIMSFDYWDSLKRSWIKFRYLLLKRSKNRNLENAANIHRNILNWLSEKIKE